MAVFDDAVFDDGVFHVPTPPSPPTPEDLTRAARLLADAKRVWGLLRGAKIERLSREYRRWWRG